MSSDRLEAWADSYGKEIHAYLWRLLGDRQDAEDCLQEAYLKAWRSDRQPIRNPRAWLYAVAGNVARSHLRRRARRRRHQAALEAEAPAPSTPRFAEDLAAVRQAVDTLPWKQKQAFLLRRFQGLSYPEIAAALGGTPEAARANVYQATRKLRTALPEAG